MKQTKLRSIFAIIISLIIGINTAQAHGVTVIKLTDQGFEPDKVIIHQGNVVTFKNESKDFRWPASNIHPTHDIYPEFDPKKVVKPGESWSFTFDKTGEWRMHDHLFPQFSGVIKVEAEQPSLTTQNKQNSHSFWQKVSQWFSGIWHRLTHWGETKNKIGNNDKNINANEKDNIAPSNYNQDIEKGAGKIFNDDIALGSHLKKYGVKDTITALRLMESKFGSCHQPAHRAGHIGNKLFGDKAFVEYSAECQSGYYHGVMEAYFKEHGAGDLKDSLSTLCQAGQNDFFEHQCIHGIGHGIMAWTNYELPDALKACDELPKRQDSCWTGVFMENLGARLATDSTIPSSTQDVGSTDIHITKYLSSDPQYPCNFVEDKYKSSCYFLQTSRMLQIFGVDFKEIAEACSQAPTIYQNACFGSMGRDVGGSFPNDLAREIKECDYITKNPQMRIECLDGAVQNSFWDPSGQDLALQFCKLLTDKNEKSSCYTTIINRAPQVILDQANMQIFCAKVEPIYQSQCNVQIK